MPCRYKEVEVLLKKLEKQMTLALLWSDAHPSDVDLNSQAPFACDKIPFEHWLQFIFIPKMTMVVNSRNSLPQNLVLMPMAEQSFLGRSHLSKVLLVIAEIDRWFECFSRESRV
ncbi:MAG: YqcC family protein [Paraglaciecola sp.]